MVKDFIKLTLKDFHTFEAVDLCQRRSLEIRLNMAFLFFKTACVNSIFERYFVASAEMS